MIMPLQLRGSVSVVTALFGPFYGAIAVPSVTRCRCCRCVHRCGHRFYTAIHQVSLLSHAACVSMSTTTTTTMTLWPHRMGPTILHHSNLQKVSAQFAFISPVTSSSDLLTSGSRLEEPAMDYVNTDFAVDSSSRYSCRALTQHADRQRNLQMQLITLPQLY